MVDNIFMRKGKNRIIKYLSIMLACVAIFSAVIYYNVNANEKASEIFYPHLIDAGNEYVEQSLTDEEKEIYTNCEIKNFYTAGERKVFRVVNKRGYISDVTMIILLNGNIIENLMGYDNQETENYGAKCFKQKYLSQFIGVDISIYNPIVGKPNNYQINEGEIVYVSGATVTSKAVLSCVNAVATFINLNSKDS